jgi:hypothetical protein
MKKMIPRVLPTPVEAARRIIKPSALNSQRVRTPITNMGAYTEHKIKAALGNDESKAIRNRRR